MNKSFKGTWKASALQAFIWFVAMLFNAGAMLLSFDTALKFAQVLEYYPDFASTQWISVATGVLFLIVSVINAVMVGGYAIQAIYRFRNDTQDN